MNDVSETLYLISDLTDWNMIACFQGRLHFQNILHYLNKQRAHCMRCHPAFIFKSYDSLFEEMQHNISKYVFLLSKFGFTILRNSCYVANVQQLTYGVHDFTFTIENKKYTVISNSCYYFNIIILVKIYYLV